jgi:membrane-anchored mycosin MYCP
MTTAASLVARLLSAACLTVVSVPFAPVAAAVTPPPVDDSRLPGPASPAPPQRTEQSEECAAAGRPVENRASSQLKDLGLRSIWRMTRGAGQTIAVIDTGVSRHRLLPHLIPGGDYVSTGDGTEDCDGHGTIVAGIIGASPDSEGADTFSGIAPDATIIGIRQSSNRFRAADDPAGSGFGDVATLAMAVRTAADLGATVINVSTVACVPVEDVLDDRALGAALAYAVDVKNVVVVAAAGNVGAPGQCREQNPTSDPAQTGQPNWTDLNVVVSPAWYDEYTLTVGSLGVDGFASQFSLAGPWVDVAAPGEDVVSLDSDGEGLVDMLAAAADSPIMGTSYAAPVVTGIAALVRARSPGLTARQVMQRIEDTARHPAAGWDPVVGHGLVDALAAVTGGPGHPPRQDSPQPRSASNPASYPTDESAGQVAIRGAAICVAMTAVLVAMTASASRLRRRPDAVPHD